jgi:hypothetical protein
MKIKWNWGTKLLIGMILFMSLMIGFMIASFMQSNDLVEDDYYAKELRYQEQIDKENNTRNLKTKIIVENVDEQLKIVFPLDFLTDSIQGEIILYRPSSEGLDVNIPLEFNDSNAIIFPTQQLIKGKYELKIDYTYLGVPYYQKQTLFIKMF